MGLLGDGGKKKNKPDPEELSPGLDDEDLGPAVEAFTDIGCDYLTALGLAWDGMSPSALREFLRKHPNCDLHTAIQILL